MIQRSRLEKVIVVTEATENYLAGRKLLVRTLAELPQESELRGEIGLYLRKAPALGTDRQEAAAHGNRNTLGQ